MATAIEVRDLEKTFRLPGQKVDSLKERVLHPSLSRDVTVLRALDGISFDVARGEFFGIVGRNGSGKSTLLKILAGIYGPDAGKVRMAGRLAPFIELGVGFNMELTARENVRLNGVMMGLSRREAARRLDAVLEFAELEEFVDLKLKNYSSGMLVRLGFSGMIQADADILLIDEVLAVGDASFQQKCADVFHELRGSGKTLVLVTHDMAAVDSYCDRAVLIAGGKIVHEGDPHEVGRHYLRLNFDQPGGGAVASDPGGSGVKIVDVWLEDALGRRTTNVELGEDINLRLVVEAEQEIARPTFSFLLTNADGIQVFGGGSRLWLDDGEADAIAAGERVTVKGRLDNPLGSGRYFVDVGVNREHSAIDNVVWVSKAVDFVIYGTEHQTGLIALKSEFSAKAERT
jgi:ABC-type polysaccharide/polyol phosphate transport system ATPase subunit